MSREHQLGMLCVIAFLAFVLIGATDRNVAAWFTFGVSVATLALSGGVRDRPRRHHHPRNFHAS